MAGFKLEIWKNNNSRRLKTEYPTLRSALKAAYEKMHGKTGPDNISIIHGFNFVGYVHWGTIDDGPWKNYTKIVVDLDGSLSGDGFYIRADGSVTPTELHKWYKSKKHPLYKPYKYDQFKKLLKE